MEENLLIDTAMLAGNILLRGGAEVYRVEDTISRILKTDPSVIDTEVLVVLTGITATVRRSDSQMQTCVSRVSNHSTNLMHIQEVNNISRKYCSGQTTLEEAHDELVNLKKQEYSINEYSLGVIITCIGFAMFFRGGIREIISSGIVGIVLSLFIRSYYNLSLPMFIKNMASGFSIAFAALLTRCIFGEELSMGIVITSSIMPLVPGMAITNAVRDTLRGDYLSGGARAMEAFIVAISITLGIGIGLTGCSIFLGGGI